MPATIDSGALAQPPAASMSTLALETVVGGSPRQARRQQSARGPASISCMNRKAHPVADGALQGLKPRGPSPPPSPRPRPSLVATFCLDHPRTARPGALHLLPGRSPITSTPTHCRRLHLGASGRFSNVAPVPTPSQSPLCPATPEHKTCLTQKGLEGRAGCGRSDDGRRAPKRSHETGS